MMTTPATGGENVETVEQLEPGRPEGWTDAQWRIWGDTPNVELDEQPYEDRPDAA